MDWGHQLGDSWQFEDEGSLFNLPRNDACEVTYCNIGAVQWLDDRRITLASGVAQPGRPLALPLQVGVPAPVPAARLGCPAHQRVQLGPASTDVLQRGAVMYLKRRAAYAKAAATVLAGWWSHRYAVN